MDETPEEAEAGRYQRDALCGRERGSLALPPLRLLDL